MGENRKILIAMNEFKNKNNDGFFQEFLDISLQKYGKDLEILMRNYVKNMSDQELGVEEDEQNMEEFYDAEIKKLKEKEDALIEKNMQKVEEIQSVKEATGKIKKVINRQVTKRDKFKADVKKLKKKVDDNLPVVEKQEMAPISGNQFAAHNN